MQWESWQAFVEMGGHGRYVWGAFAGVALACLAEVCALRWALRQQWRALQEDEATP